MAGRQPGMQDVCQLCRQIAGWTICRAGQAEIVHGHPPGSIHDRFDCIQFDRPAAMGIK